MTSMNLALGMVLEAHRTHVTAAPLGALIELIGQDTLRPSLRLNYRSGWR
jgi:hypothetical protein